MAGVLLPRTSPTQGLWSRLDQRGRFAVICGMAAMVAYLGAGGTTVARALVGGFGLLVFVLIAFSGRQTALTMIIVWLVLLGFVRRGLIPFAGWAGNDPLLLVSPAAGLTLWLSSRRESTTVRVSALAGFAGFLLLWAGAQVMNPHESSLVVAAQGLLFYLTPLVWFFVGRTLTTGQHERILNVVLWMNLVVALHGLYQSFVGFLPFELTWLHVSNQGASVFLPGFKVRPFSTLVSPQEYGIYLSFSAVVIWSQILRPTAAWQGAKRKWLGVFLAVTLVALFFQGARGALMLTILALTITLVAHLRSFLAFLGVAAVVAMAAMWVGAQDVSKEVEIEAGGSAASAEAVVGHQLSGLTNPSSSSATLHLEQAIQGFQDGWRNPLGLGVSEATIARARAEGSEVTPENDIGNTMVALGIPGGAALVGIIITGFAGATRLQRLQPSALHLAWLGILVAGVGQWLNGALYAVSTILFIALGGISRGLRSDDPDDEDDYDEEEDDDESLAADRVEVDA